MTTAMTALTAAATGTPMFRPASSRSGTASRAASSSPGRAGRSPSPRVRGEGRGEGAVSQAGACEAHTDLAERQTPPTDAQTRGEAPSPVALTRADLSPHAGRGEVAAESAPENHAPIVPLTAAALYRLMTWMSPAYPVGAFSYSSGIEWAVDAGDIGSAETLCKWLATMIRQGSVLCDAALFAHAHRATVAGDDTALAAVAELAVALAGSKERFLETTAQGQAFRDITRAAWPTPALDRLAAAWDGPLAYPVVVAAACAGHSIALAPALDAYLHSVVSNLISAGVRLIPLGQTDGQRVLAALETEIAHAATRARNIALGEIGSTAPRADIASMRHETQYTRLFRS
jgi:urease accessory protein